ncbi:MAG: methyl-accepting chemotaxis protein [Lachnospiraceae bacterium]|nr:methyl-accepting chemotaxis protein [Lachnospiraceae bacterium]
MAAPMKRNRKILIKIILIALGALIAVTTIITIIAGVELSNTYESLIEEELKATCEHLDDELGRIYTGDWTLDESGNLYKGGHIVTGRDDILDGIKSKTGIEYTLFFGKTRMLTTLIKAGTSERMNGTQAGDAVYATVVTQGQDFYAPDLVINGQPYSAYYTPLIQPDGTRVGMVFAGRASSGVTAAIRRIILTMVAVAVALVGMVLVLGMMVALKTSKKMAGIADSINELASGDLRAEVDETLLSRKDELGTIADSTKQFKEKIAEVIGTTRQMSEELHNSSSSLSESAGQASTASSQVSDAIGEVSKGAVSQAESIQTAAANTDGIGRDIDEISDNVSQLDDYTGQMKKSCDDAMGAMEKLIAQSQEVMASVKEIDNTIHSTNESAKGISQFSDAITDIAEETNLLSLNASIEAARAGEAGKGFAVVASQIQKLADQSKQSADQIKDIVERLLSDSEASVEVMNRLNENFAAQGEQLSSTQQDMIDMSANVKNVEASSRQITSRVEDLNQAKMSLVEIIQDLSAISEENAASTEETNASMQELNATFSVISESAAQLQVLADNLQNTISFFQD